MRVESFGPIEHQRRSSDCYQNREASEPCSPYCESVVGTTAVGMPAAAARGVLRHFPVERRVGNVNFDNPSCIASIELEVAQALL